MAVGSEPSVKVQEVNKASSAPAPAHHPALTETIVSFRSVSKGYDAKTLVVDNLSLDIVKGEFLTLLGPSGSGKTTTLMMLAGFESPSLGSIFMNGQDITDLPP